jgi:hypothetical protein
MLKFLLRALARMRALEIERQRIAQLELFIVLE